MGRVLGKAWFLLKSAWLQSENVVEGGGTKIKLWGAGKGAGRFANQ